MLPAGLGRSSGQQALNIGFSSVRSSLAHSPSSSLYFLYSFAFDSTIANTMNAHQNAVARVASRTRHFYDTRTPYRVYHGATNSTRRSQRRLDNIIDTSDLDRILHMDETNKVALVEPNVPMDSLVQSTLKHGLVPLVVMEFPGITVGGGFSGTSGESSSFRYGAFDATINFIEIVTPDGKIVRASKTDKPDLFWGAASAFGTLGIVTLLEVQLRDAAKYVELTYRRTCSSADTNALLLEENSKDTVAYLDGIVFSPTSSVVCTGRLTDDIPVGIQPRRFVRSRDPWFYVHAQRVEKRLKKQGPKATETDYIPIEDYLFRYNRGGFWAARYAFKYFLTPFNRITRFILDPFMQTRVMYCAMHQSGLSDFYVIQDVGIPYDKAEEFTDWLDECFKIYPLWLCPLRIRRDSPDAAHGLHSEFADQHTPDLLNFGIWGPVSFDRREVVRKNRELERKVQELGGKKWLYAHTYYTEEEFWASYDRRSYDTLRSKYHATYLPSVFDKVRVDFDAEEAAVRASWTAWLMAIIWSIWPLRGLYGVYKAILGGDYLLQKKPPAAQAKAVKAD